MSGSNRAESAFGRNGLLVRVAVLLLLVGAAVVLFLSPLRDYLTLEWIGESLREIRAQIGAFWWAPIAFVLAYALGSLAFAPATVFTVAAAVIWGWKLGTLYAVIGGGLGAFLSFEAARWLFGNRLRATILAKAPRVAEMLDGAGIRTVAVSRMIPGIPFPVLNYVSGLAALRTRNYVIGMLIGHTIPTAIICYSAEALLAGTLEPSEAAWRLAQAGALLVILMLLPTVAKRLIIKRNDVTDEPDTARTVVN